MFRPRLYVGPWPTTTCRTHLQANGVTAQTPMLVNDTRVSDVANLIQQVSQENRRPQGELDPPRG